MTMPIWHSTTINPFMHLLLTNPQYKKWGQELHDVYYFEFTLAV